jgi:hypothetical protein
MGVLAHWATAPRLGPHHFTIPPGGVGGEGRMAGGGKGMRRLALVSGLRRLVWQLRVGRFVGLGMREGVRDESVCGVREQCERGERERTYTPTCYTHKREKQTRSWVGLSDN